MKKSQASMNDNGNGKRANLTKRGVFVRVALSLVCLTAMFLFLFYSDAPVATLAVVAFPMLFAVAVIWAVR